MPDTDSARMIAVLRLVPGSEARVSLGFHNDGAVASRAVLEQVLDLTETSDPTLARHLDLRLVDESGRLLFASPLSRARGVELGRFRLGQTRAYRSWARALAAGEDVLDPGSRQSNCPPDLSPAHARGAGLGDEAIGKSALARWPEPI